MVMLAQIERVAFGIGLVVAAALIALLVATRALPWLRIWPTPGDKTWQSYVFWPLFRGLNVLCFVVAVLDISIGLGLSTWLRLLAAVALAAAVVLFLYAFFVLGRDNSYGAQGGLATRGIYRWSRNPQNAMLVVVYGALALAADTAHAYLLCAAMMVVYVLMVLTEEPWLVYVYGERYRRYCRRVPRFFNWHRAALAMRMWLRRRTTVSTA
jgi:protein-S-isoprenylcysteine O-methyltransferase Ste14